MLRAWLLTIDILIGIRLVKLPQQEQSDKLNRHLDQNKE